MWICPCACVCSYCALKILLYIYEKQNIIIDYRCNLFAWFVYFQHQPYERTTKADNKASQIYELEKESKWEMKGEKEQEQEQKRETKIKNLEYWRQTRSMGPFNNNEIFHNFVTMQMDLSVGVTSAANMEI